jgi:Heparinase II/III-like protein
MWHGVSTLLDAQPSHADLSALTAQLARADAVVAHLTDPTGATVAIGDGWPVRTDPPVVQKTLGLTSRVDGLAAWRWSWTDPTTTYWTDHFGPKRIAHGHYDHTSFTFTTLGVPIVVDPGDYSYDLSRRLAAWQSSPAAHNVAVPLGAKLTNKGSSLIAFRRTGQIDRLALRSTMFSTPVTRVLTVDNAHHRVTVTDQAAGRTLTAHLHLAAGWRYSSRTARSMSFVRGNTRLVITAPAGTALTYRVGRTAPLCGWVFTSLERATRAIEILATGFSAVTTNLTVTRNR